MIRNQTFFMDLVGVINKCWGKHLHGDSADWLFENFIKEAHPFLFTLPTEVTTETVEPVEDPLDLPYPVISVEVLNGYVTTPHWDDEMRVWINCFIVREIAPKEYEFLAYCEFAEANKAVQPLYKDEEAFNDIARLIQYRNQEKRPSLARVTKESDPTNFAIFNGLLKRYLERLSKERMGQAGRENKIKIGTGKDKQFYRPKNIVVVTPKNNVETLTASGEGGTIDWSYRWEVRGHWRTVKGVGKDRAGNYIVPGFTWIPNHVRGPEDKPIMKKSYLITE
jgi:hypothetical protein